MHAAPPALRSDASIPARRQPSVFWRAALLLALALPIVLTACAPWGTTTARKATPTPTAAPAVPAKLDFPAVDPNYIYLQLAYMATTFQHRQAGYVDGASGHDGFATYWAQTMQRNLAGFGPTVSRDLFSVAGWSGSPATAPAVNVEVTIPGVAHPDQVVVIGCHYDGEASSTQSANDDASGCAIELGVAQALGAYWRAHHLYPARTLRFVIFDAEEQGIFGSFHYLNQTINGDISNVMAMFNEEQNGIAYPLRFLGKTSNPLLPFFALTSPTQNNSFYTAQDQLSATKRNAISTFTALAQQAVPVVFAKFQSLGYTSLAYQDPGGATVNQPIFAPSQVNNVQVGPDYGAGSDQIPFTLAGLPCTTFVGNSTYYDPAPPPWSYPFDQPQDTIQLMNTFANDTATEAPALTLSLALPGMFTTWMLKQPAVLGFAAGDGKPLAAIGDVGPTVVAQSVAFDANATYDPADANAAFTDAWNFGDGATAQGLTVTHTYAHTGTYTVTLTIRSSSGASRVVRKTVTVTTAPTALVNPYGDPKYAQNGTPPNNPAVALPTPGA